MLRLRDVARGSDGRLEESQLLVLVLLNPSCRLRIIGWFAAPLWPTGPAAVESLGPCAKLEPQQHFGFLI